MENVSTENVEVDEKGMGISQYCLSLPTIVRPIMEHLSNKELIQVSLVNKLWNFEARSVLREQRNLRACTVTRLNDPPPHSCQEIAAFASDLEKMHIVPFTGIRMSIFHPEPCKSISDGSLEAAYKVILDRLPCKSFTVRFCNDWDDYKACPALLLVHKIVQKYCGVLQELSLQLGKEECLRSIFQGVSLPCLQVLFVEKRFIEEEEPEYLTDAFLKTLVSSAPKLEEVYIEGDNDFSVNILEESSAVLIPRSVLKPLFHEVCESLIGSLRLESMEILLQEDDDVDRDLLHRLIPKLLNASVTWLETLTMDLLFAVPLICYGICLENVTKLELHMNCQSLQNLEPSIRRLPTGLDFTRVFPSLTEVIVLDHKDLDFSPDVIGTFIGYASVVLSRALPDRAVKIEVLKIDRCTWLEDGTLPLLAQMFPNVKKVQVQRGRERASFTDLREHFPCLEEVIDSRYGMPYS